MYLRRIVFRHDSFELRSLIEHRCLRSFQNVIFAKNPCERTSLHIVHDFSIESQFCSGIPPFPAGVDSTQFTMDQGTSAAAVPNGASGTVAMSVFASGGRFGCAETVNGTNYVSGELESPANVPTYLGNNR
jgi:hypothetical protein